MASYKILTLCLIWQKCISVCTFFAFLISRWINKYLSLKTQLTNTSSDRELKSFEMWCYIAKSHGHEMVMVWSAFKFKGQGWQQYVSSQRQEPLIIQRHSVTIQTTRILWSMLSNLLHMCLKVLWWRNVFNMLPKAGYKIKLTTSHFYAEVLPDKCK